MSKRYLVVQTIDEEFEEAEGFVLVANPGDEIVLDDEMAEVVSRKRPGILREMDPRTKTDWERD